MQELSSIVILILCVYTVIGVLDQISIQIGVYTPLFAATFTGFLLGDIKSGLFIGATLQLATLGVATYGGATVPDYLSGAIIGTSYAILSQRGAEYGIAIAVPIGLLLTQLDILGRMTNVIFQHKADRYAEEGNYKGVEMCNVLGTLPWVLSRVIPVFIGLFLIMFSIFFYVDVFNYQSTNFEYIFYSGATILTFIVPILTMRTIAEERKSGTEQLLLTSPLSITKIVLGKFISAILIVVITELFTFMYFGILSFFGSPHITTALVTLLGFLLLAMSYISFGILASSITENQIIAGVITIGFFILTWFLPNFSSIFNNFSLINIFTKFPSGQIDIADTITFITFTITCLLLTIIVMQRRKSVR